MQRNIIDFDPHRRPASAEQTIRVPQLVVSAQRTAKHFLRELLPECFASIDDSLFALADKAENNQQQALYFDAMRETRLQKDNMIKAYFEALEAGFDASLRADTGNQYHASASLDQIGLVEDEQLEESLAVTNMSGNAENLYREALFALTARLNFLFDELEITSDNNPLRPEVLCEAFTGAIKQTDADIKVRLIIYKLFDKFVVQKLGPMYDTLNADLVAAGVLPRIRSTIRKSEHEPVAGAGADMQKPLNDELAAMTDTDTNPDPSQDMFSALQQLLSRQRGAGPASAGGVGAGSVGGGATTGIPGAGVATAGLPGGEVGEAGTGGISGGATYATSDVLTALSRLQTSDTVQLAAGTQQSSAELIKTTLISEIGALTGDSGEQKNIDQANTDAIDIVSMLFDFVLDDPSLPDHLKAQIARLQIPLLKVAILDTEFFAQKSHAARQLLNELAYAGSDMVDGDPEQDATFQMVCYVVERVLIEFEDNLGIFDELLTEFTEFMERERETNRRAAEMQEQAKEVVAAEIQRRITDNRVPPLVMAILVEAWKDVLTRLYLRDGDGSTAWNTALQVADDLIWSVQPKLVVSERQRLIKVIPRVLNGLRDGLTLIRFDREATERLFAGLEELHIASLRGSIADPREETPAAPEIDSDDFGVDLSEMPGGEDTDGDFMEEIVLASTQPMDWNPDALPASRFTEDVKEMPLGTWVEFIDPDNERRQRGKLAWKCDFTGEYTFVDRKYKVVADISSRKLIEELERGRAVFVEDVPLFDRALDSVISGIKRALERGETAPAH